MMMQAFILAKKCHKTRLDDLAHPQDTPQLETFLFGLRVKRDSSNQNKSCEPRYLVNPLMVMSGLLESDLFKVQDSVTETMVTATEAEQVASKLELGALGVSKQPARIKNVSPEFFDPLQRFGRTTHLVVRWNQYILMLKGTSLVSVAPSPPTLNLSR